MIKKKQKEEKTPLTVEELQIMQDYNRPSFWTLIGDTQSFIKDFDNAKKNDQLIRRIARLSSTNK